MNCVHRGNRKASPDDSHNPPRKKKKTSSNKETETDQTNNKNKNDKIQIPPHATLVLRFAKDNHQLRMYHERAQFVTAQSTYLAQRARPVEDGGLGCYFEVVVDDDNDSDRVTTSIVEWNQNTKFLDQSWHITAQESWEHIRFYCQYGFIQGVRRYLETLEEQQHQGKLNVDTMVFTIVYSSKEQKLQIPYQKARNGYLKQCLTTFGPHGGPTMFQKKHVEQLIPILVEIAKEHDNPKSNGFLKSLLPNNEHDLTRVEELQQSLFPSLYVHSWQLEMMRNNTTTQEPQVQVEPNPLVRQNQNNQNDSEELEQDPNRQKHGNSDDEIKTEQDPPHITSESNHVMEHQKTKSGSGGDDGKRKNPPRAKLKAHDVIGVDDSEDDNDYKEEAEPYTESSEPERKSNDQNCTKQNKKTPHPQQNAKAPSNNTNKKDTNNRRNHGRKKEKRDTSFHSIQGFDANAELGRFGYTSTNHEIAELALRVKRAFDENTNRQTGKKVRQFCWQDMPDCEVYRANKLQAEAWKEEFELWMTSAGLSTSNKSSTRKVVTQFVDKGWAVTIEYWMHNVFLLPPGNKHVMECNAEDLESLRRTAKQWDSVLGDSCNGWLRTPLNKIIQFVKDSQDLPTVSINPLRSTQC